MRFLEELSWVIKISLDKCDLGILLEQFLGRWRLNIASHRQYMKRCIFSEKILDQRASLLASCAGDQDGGHVV